MMRSRRAKMVACCAALVILLVVLVLCPSIDLAVSGLFYRTGEGFFLADNPLFVALHWFAVYGAWALGFVLLALAVSAYICRTNILGMAGKGWLFLLLALLLGPVLLANVVFKDNWGRARPHTVQEFGGSAHFTPAAIMAHECQRNCSFVSGDGSFGFFLPAFAYVMPGAATRRRVFWGTMAAGVLIGFARIAMGAHFFSDVVFAAILMSGLNALLYKYMFGQKSDQHIVIKQ